MFKSYEDHSVINLSVLMWHDEKWGSKPRPIGLHLLQQLIQIIAHARVKICATLGSFVSTIFHLTKFINRKPILQ